MLSIEVKYEVIYGPSNGIFFWPQMTFRGQRSKSNPHSTGKSSLLEMIVVYNCNFIILGDVNINLDVAPDLSTKKFSSNVDSFGLSQMVETPRPVILSTSFLFAATNRKGFLSRFNPRWFLTTLSSRFYFQFAVLHRFHSTWQRGHGKNSSEDAWNKMSVEKFSGTELHIPNICLCLFFTLYALWHGYTLSDSTDFHPEYHKGAVW